MMTRLRELAYRIDPVLWVREVLAVTPTAWQEQFLRSPRGASILALTARQVGKTTTAAWGIAHSMLFTPGSLSVIACPAQRQSAEAVRRVREALVKAGAKFRSENVYGLELDNGSRVLALPGSDDSIRLKATADTDSSLFAPGFLDQERAELGEHAFNREYLGIPGSAQASLFTWDLFDRATRIHVPAVPHGRAFRPPAEPPRVPMANPFRKIQPTGGVP
jgi:hypothetical protein